MREIVFDTETTGLDPNKGDRLVEIGCVELLNRIPTGATFHAYLNPDRDMPAEAFNIHGLSIEFLRTHKRFADVVDDFLAFIGDDAPLVAHNANFDHGFLCAELKRHNRAVISRDRLVDTLALARRKHTGPYSLDALCGKYGIDNSRRTKHGALLDAEILAEVYLELLGGRQSSFGLAETVVARKVGADGIALVRERPAPLTPRLTDAERAAHTVFIATLGENAIWRSYSTN
ncbi:MAG: DNA polymerase III subunit epsilon [Pseudolabrys sp.]|nr:DNA polymerase III subunit epsilon [Pseudolabrys sp.]